MISTVVMYISMRLAFVLLFPFDLTSEDILWPNITKMIWIQILHVRIVLMRRSSVFILVHRAYSNVCNKKKYICVYGSVLECEPSFGEI